jgi:Flp pilus assembly secretin CpaC
MNFYRSTGLFFLLLLFNNVVSANLQPESQSLKIIKGRSQLVQLTSRIKSIYVLDRKKVHVKEVNSKSFLVSALNVGETEVVVILKNNQVRSFLIEVRSTNARQVLLRVRMIEVSKNHNESLGVNIGLRTSAETSLMEKLADSAIAGAELMSFGRINVIKKLKNHDMTALIDSMGNKNLIRLLAQPDLLCVEGEESRFVVGGEYPVTTSNIHGQTTSYKEYGIQLKALPKMIDIERGRVLMKIAPEVSDIQIGGSFLKRNVDTTVEVSSGQSLVIAGLINETTSNQLRFFPGISSVPVLGALFKSKSYLDRKSDLVVVVTPEIIGFKNEKDYDLSFLEKIEENDEIKSILYARYKELNRYELNLRGFGEIGFEYAPTIH